MKKKVLFICTHNSARSQMAEGLMRTLYPDRYVAYSAGTEPSGVNPYAVKVMVELGIDISSHRSKHVNEFFGMDIDYVIMVCDHAKQICPFSLVVKSPFTKVSRTPPHLTEMRMRKSPFSGASGMRSESGLWKPLVGKGGEKG